jgi:cardiolipin synthase A/B
LTIASDPGPTAPAPSPSGGRLDNALERTSAASLRGGNRLDLLQNGPDTYDDWLSAIAGARRWVHLDNYIFSDDEVGRRFAEALRHKAAEDVPVRVLYDWFGCLSTPRSFWQGLREAGVEARPVNPLALTTPLGTVRRDHRKLLAVDGEYGSTGGVCIDEGWLARDPQTGLPYRDTAVSVRGPPWPTSSTPSPAFGTSRGIPCPKTSVPGPRASRARATRPPES